MRGGNLLRLRTAAIVCVRTAAIVCAAAALCVALAACGSGTAHPSSTATASPIAGTASNLDAIDEARVKASSCMRSQGINIPDIGRGRGQILQVLRIVASYPQAKVQAAIRGCASEIRRAFPNAASLSPQQLARRRQQARVFAQCMRAHGINFPDPTASTTNPAAYLDALSTVDFSSPAFKSATLTCRGQALKG